MLNIIRKMQIKVTVRYFTHVSTGFIKKTRGKCW